MKTGELIKLLRAKKKISQGKFADIVDITPNYLSSIENGKKKPSFKLLQNVSDYFQLPINLLLLEEIDYSKFQDNKTKQLAKNIENTLEEIKKELVKKLLE